MGEAVVSGGDSAAFLEAAAARLFTGRRESDRAASAIGQGAGPGGTPASEAAYGPSEFPSLPPEARRGARRVYRLWDAAQAASIAPRRAGTCGSPSLGSLRTP